MKMKMKMKTMTQNPQMMFMFKKTNIYSTKIMTVKGCEDSMSFIEFY